MGEIKEFPGVKIERPDTSNEFGTTLNEMDVEAFINARDWLQKALEAQGAARIGAGVGLGQADIDIELEGARFNVSIRPLGEPEASHD